MFTCIYQLIYEHVTFQIYGWVPEYYNNTKDLPSDMPPSLVQHIKSINSSWVS